jgi:hypothetical protein
MEKRLPFSVRMTPEYRDKLHNLAIAEKRTLAAMHERLLDYYETTEGWLYVFNAKKEGELK